MSASCTVSADTLIRDTIYKSADLIDCGRQQTANAHILLPEIILASMLRALIRFRLQGEQRILDATTIDALRTLFKEEGSFIQVCSTLMPYN